MAMKRLYEFSQSADKFEKEPAGVCQALSAQWIVARAKWQAAGGRGAWADASWMGARKDMSEHVDRIYAATRAARKAVALQEESLMKQEIQRFSQEKAALLTQQQRRAPNMSAPLAADEAPPPAVPGYTEADLERRLGAIHVPTLPRMLEAVMNDIAGQANLSGAVHTHGNAQSTAAAHKVCSLNVGYNLVDVRDRSLASEGGAHAIAAEIRMNETRLFDPNWGEWVSVPPGNAWSSFGTQLNFLLQNIYELESVNTLSVIHFKLQA